jgi:hypothetical protein
MDSDSIRTWLESQGWYEYLNWLLAQPSDPFMSAMFLIGIVFAVGLVLVIFMGTGENRDENRFSRDHRIYKDNGKINK